MVLSFNSLIIILQIIFLESILSMDNAMVLATIAQKLPENKKVPLPKFLQFLYKPLKILNNQRQAVLEVGLFGAYLGRGLMLFLTSLIIQNTWLKIIGALYLIHLAMNHLGDITVKKESVEHEIEEELEEDSYLVKQLKNTKSFWRTLLIIELADLIFSLDNVIAIVALTQNFIVLMIGVALGILLMRIAAQKLIPIIEKIPELGIAAYILIFNIAIELLLETTYGIHFSETQKFLISTVTVITALAYAMLPSNIKRKTSKLFKIIGTSFYYLDKVITFKWLKNPEE